MRINSSNNEFCSLNRILISTLICQSRRTPTLPSAPVRALRPDWPRDVRSPFYNSAGEMRPFARLRLTRLRLYEKSCDAAGNASGNLQLKSFLSSFQRLACKLLMDHVNKSCNLLHVNHYLQLRPI